MKLTPKIYAQWLAESADTKNLKNFAEKFWKLLQKNKQYKDLGKILEEIDVEHAKKENLLLARISSSKELSPEETKKIENSLEKKYGKKTIIKLEINKNITGVIVQVDEDIIDLSLENNVTRLKKAIKQK